MDNKENMVFDLTMLAGQILLENGAEIFRVEETMIIIAKSFQIKNIDVFAITNGIFMSMTTSDNGNHSGQVKHVPISVVHLGRVTAVNNLSRGIAAGKYSIEEAYAELERISNIPYESRLLRIFAAGVGSASFCYLLGGSIADSFVAFISGFLLYIFIVSIQKSKIPGMLKNVFGGAFVTIISILLFSFGLGDNINRIIIGAIICMIPGVSLTTSVRNFFNGDYLSGTVRLVDALLVSLSISVGVGTIITSWERFF